MYRCAWCGETFDTDDSPLFDETGAELRLCPTCEDPSLAKESHDDN